MLGTLAGMSAIDVEPILTIRGPADLICVIPYLLGFHPDASLVVIGLDRGRIVVTIRVDLDGLAGSGDVEHAVAAMRRGGATDFVGVVVDADATDARASMDDGPLPWSELAAELVDAVEYTDGVVGDVLLFADGRYWSYLCRAQGCCPPEGTELPSDCSEVAATATYAGMVALPGRESIERLLDPLPTEERSHLTPVIDEAVEVAAIMSGTKTLASWNRADVRALFSAARSADKDPSLLASDPELLARYAAALRRFPVRDSVWMAVDDGRLDGDALWRHLARRLPAPYDAAPRFLIGWAAWRNGSGAFARIAADRALASDPGYSAADLLLGALNNAVDPRMVPKLKRRERICDR